MVLAANLGFPRIGKERELKSALEHYWRGEITEQALSETAKSLRQRHWKLQQQAGMDIIPSNDFSYYDIMLDTAVMVGAIPERYNVKKGAFTLNTYFAMARGAQHAGVDVQAMEMTKWFDTNYHYIVPELPANQTFALSSLKAVDEFKEAKALGIHTRPVLIGPITFLLLGKMKGHGNTLQLLDKLLPVYGEILTQLQQAGADWVQMDEPVLVQDLTAEAKQAFTRAYSFLKQAAPSLRIALTTYFGGLEDNLATVSALPIDALHIDAVRAPEQVEAVLHALPRSVTLSIGIIDGRNIWKNNYDKSLTLLKKAANLLGKDRIIVAPSCSLLHTPVDLALETTLDAEIKSWLAFATQKLAEIALLKQALEKEDDVSVRTALDDNRRAIAARNSSSRIHNPKIKETVQAVTDALLHRQSPYPVRAKRQREVLDLPLLPTTTIGSFPQTNEIRVLRADLKKGKLSQEQYDHSIQSAVQSAITLQQDMGIDVLVDGEFNRNDMVEYFGELLEGFVFTKFGWVQSYGSRCVKPPIIFGDISRPLPMTVKWSSYAQSLTKKKVKGMLTGPVTILQWSFVRDDQPRSETCKQIALAIREEVQDLEKAGIQIIQIDEPAIREGLPIRKRAWKDYLLWAVNAFKLSSAGVKDATQIHTHMCYSEFNDIIDSIAAMDADVISIETSRSQMELLEAFSVFKYPNEIGPGVYDIHSPRIPSKEEIKDLLVKALQVLAPEQIWVNPDCGLKTRRWEEVKPALVHMVEAAKELRSTLSNTGSQVRHIVL